MEEIEQENGCKQGEIKLQKFGHHGFAWWLIWFHLVLTNYQSSSTKNSGNLAPEFITFPAIKFSLLCA